MEILLAVACFALGCAAVAAFSSASRRKEVAEVRGEGQRLVADAQRDADATRRESVVAADEAGREVLAQAEAELRRAQHDAKRRDERLARREVGVVGHEEDAAARKHKLDSWYGVVRSRDKQARQAREETKQIDEKWKAGLEEVAGRTAHQVRTSMVDSILEETTSQAAATLRNFEADHTDELETEARRVMGIVSQRNVMHYLTERSVSVLPFDPEVVDRVFGPDESNLRVIEEIAGVKLNVQETGDTIRLEGLDGVGREIARRTLSRMWERENGDARALAQGAAAELDREILDFGKKAFRILRLKLAQEEIVRLVGRLNWRTSYTQNQWKHALEAAHLAAMMASELGLDVTIARRGALLHDIGKSLTHEREGSHAVIGAEIARRVGEDEIICNCIGAHHGEEPANTPYADLVTAGDAMSGGRPGARREQTDGFGRRVEELERIAQSYQSVDRVYAVQGGREVRVYVKETQVDDAACIQLSEEIAKRISEEVIFPGQIKVTVIREMCAVEFAS